MKTRLSLVALVALSLLVFASVSPAQVKPAAAPAVADLGLKLGKDHYVLYETVTGSVSNLAIGESLTVELVDATGRTLVSQNVPRAGAKLTPFSFRIDLAPTIYCSVVVTTTKGRKSSTPILIPPSSSLWDDFPIIVTKNPAGFEVSFFNSARILGIDAGLISSDSKGSDLLEHNLGFFISPIFPARLVTVGAPVPGPIPGAIPAPVPVPDAEPAPVPPAAPAPVPAPVPEVPAKGKPAPGPSRLPSLADPEAVNTWQKTLDDAIIHFKDSYPVGYCLGDRFSVGNGTDAVDFSFDDRTLQDFRVWLQARYSTKSGPSLNLLNVAWGTKFRAWNEVVPVTAEETLKTQFGKTMVGRKTRTLAAWYDHRVFMDFIFARTLSSLVSRSHDAARANQTLASVGLTGTFGPAPYGGYDWSQLVDSLDWFEAPDDFRSKALVAAVNRRRRDPAYTLTFLDDKLPVPLASRQLWQGVLLGDHGVLVHDGSGLIDARGAVTPSGLDLAWQLRLLRDGLGRLFANSEMAPVHDGVAIYYSQPSIRVQWMLDAASNPEKSFLGRSVDDTESTTLAARLGWMELLDDLRIGYTFVSSRNVVEDPKALSGISVLVLPKTVAMGKDEVARLNAWVRSGGAIIADSQTALYDADGVQQDEGQLDTLFGIGRTDALCSEAAGKLTSITKVPLRIDANDQFKNIVAGVTPAGLYPVESSVRDMGARCIIESGRVQAVFIRKVNSGTAVYLNLSVLAYHRDHFDAAKVVGLKRLVGRILASVGVTPRVAVAAVKGFDLNPVDVDVIRCANGPLEVVALMRRPAPPAVVQPAPAPGEAPAEPEAQPAEPEAPQPEPAPEPEPGPPPGPVVPPAPGPPPGHVAPPAPVPPPVPGFAPGNGPLAVPVDDNNEPAEANPPAPVVPDAQNNVPENAPENAPEPAPAPENPAAPKEAPKEAEPVKAPPVPHVKLTLPRLCHAYDVLHGQYLGRVKEVEVEVAEDAPTLIACLPYEVRNIKVELKLQEKQLSYQFSIDTGEGARVGTHIFHVDFFDPKDQPSYIHAINVEAKSGYASGAVSFAVGDLDGTWKIVVTDVITGKQVDQTVELK